MTDEQLAYTVSRGGILMIAFGVVLLTVILAEGRRRLMTAAGVGVVAAFVIASMEESGGAGWAFVALLAAGGGLGLVAGVALIGFVALLRLWRPTRRMVDALPPRLDPVRWGAPPDAPRERPAALDIARRWFVAIAAGTGGAVAALVTLPEFSAALGASISPSSLLSAAVVALVSLVLVGPVQDFVFERPVAAADGKAAPPTEIVALLTSGMSARSMLRLGLVGAALLVLELVFNSLDESIQASRANAPTMILLVGITPGVVSYYWAAALQSGRSLSGLTAPATVAATLFAATLFYVWSMAEWLAVPGLAYTLLGVPQWAAVTLLALAPLGAILFAFVGNALAFGLPALVGGVVIERLRGGVGVGALLVVLALALAAPPTVFLLAVRAGASMYLDQYVFVAGQAVGWIVGLLASDFPGLVRASPHDAASEASETAVS